MNSRLRVPLWKLNYPHATTHLRSSLWKRRRTEASYKPERPQQLHDIGALQDGRFNVLPNLNQQGDWMIKLHGLKGCSCPYTSTVVVTKRHSKVHGEGLSLSKSNLAGFTPSQNLTVCDELIGSNRLISCKQDNQVQCQSVSYQGS